MSIGYFIYMDYKFNCIQRLLECLQDNENDSCATLVESDDYYDFEKIVKRYFVGDMRDEDIKRLREMNTLMYTGRIMRDIRLGIIKDENGVDNALKQLKETSHIMNKS